MRILTIPYTTVFTTVPPLHSNKDDWLPGPPLQICANASGSQALGAWIGIHCDVWHLMGQFIPSTDLTHVIFIFHCSCSIKMIHKKNCSSYQIKYDELVQTHIFTRLESIFPSRCKPESRRGQRMRLFCDSSGCRSNVSLLVKKSRDKEARHLYIEPRKVHAQD